MTTISLEAQIRDDEASQNLLAVQCSLNSGLPAENYEEYCRKLSMVVGLLDSTQQERVFGYVPSPAAFAEETGGQYNTSGGGTTDWETSDSGSGDISTDDFGSTESGDGNTPATTNSDSKEGDSGEESDWWGDFFSWLGGILGGDPIDSDDVSRWAQEFGEL
ncbi:MAG: hypothetical protein AAGA96_17835 [Verrucomicrobiota bacterium]